MAVSWEDWVLTTVFVLCVIALSWTGNTISNSVKCEVYHEARRLCTTYDGDRMHHHRN